MTRAILSLAVALAIAFLGTLSMPVSGQSSAAPPLVVTAYNGGPATPYTVPRTPWGDPDLQGVWSSDDTSGIPRERPKNLGNRLYQTDEDFAARRKQVENGVKRGESDIGSFRNDFARRAFRQTSLIVDPPDGSMPAFTPLAETRRASRDRGTFGEGPFNTTEDFTLYDRCITRGIVGSVLRVVYGNGNRIVQAPGYGGVQLRDDSRHARHVHGRPPASRAGHPAVPGRLAGPVGGRRAGGGHHQPDRQDQHRRQRQRPAPQRQDGDHRALQAGG
jgi:hypothetical protein